MTEDEKRLWRQTLVHHPRGMVVTVAAAVGVAVSLGHQATEAVWLWLVGMLGFTLVRALLHVLCMADLRQDAARSHWRAFQRWHAAGMLVTGLQWAGLAWWGVPHYQGVEQFTILIVLSALAGGATATLAPMRVVGKLYILLVLLPACWQLGQLGGTAHTVFAVLGSVFAWVMVSSHESTHQVLRQIVALDQEKDALVVALSARSNEAMQANAELERRVAERTRALLYKTQHDTLTRLLNRRGLTEAHRQPAGQEGDVWVLAQISLDHFKRINEALGHDWGDLLLRAVARRLAERASRLAPCAEGPPPVLCRWGGDEFMLSLMWPQAHPDAVLQAMETLRQALAEPYALKGRKLAVGVSLGFSARAWRADATLADAVQQAELALTEAKRTGRGRTAEATLTLQLLHARRTCLVEALRTATADGSLSLLFQPIVSAHTCRPEAYEALLRWRCAGMGPISPVEFIPLAEDTGQICAIGHWVLQTACRQAAAWPAGPEGQAPKVAVNTSLRQLLQADFAGEVRQALAQAGLAPQRLVVEVTESVFNEGDIDRVLATLLALRQMGIEVHVDDFGTGYSSLSRLHEFPLTAVKVDKSFVLTADERALAVIEGTVLIARRFGLRVIAEGVETAEQARVLARLGVDELQGYYFGRPAPLPVACGSAEALPLPA
ncbi:putative bifunctional diguanylate cyclase/phosphodiesterase [Ideonella oryzae]|uniref:EAL domain-containing protein n=1 Tax=Ideonella oryzae TaxID=2937441 RepID=A0ABT1BNH1_9BURK|nr:GGDEF domain-containing phosphodiesterase [Ideonella oryzae]MCO5977693.1 EAL domain-containing protein [Ideonella oryzae]